MGFPETYEIDAGSGFYKQIGNAVGLVLHRRGAGGILQMCVGFGFGALEFGAQSGPAAKRVSLSDCPGRMNEFGFHGDRFSGEL